MLPCLILCKYPHDTARFHASCLWCRTRAWAYNRRNRSLRGWTWSFLLGIPIPRNPKHAERRSLTCLTPQGKKAIYSTPIGVQPDLDGAFWNYVLIINKRRRFASTKDILLKKAWTLAEYLNDRIENDYENKLLWKLRQRVLNVCEALC